MYANRIVRFLFFYFPSLTRSTIIVFFSKHVSDCTFDRKSFSYKARFFDIRENVFVDWIRIFTSLLNEYVLCTILYKHTNLLLMFRIYQYLYYSRGENRQINKTHRCIIISWFFFFQINIVSHVFRLKYYTIRLT